MTGTFIISLDCEGKWGLADRPQSTHDFMTRGRMIGVYENLLRLLRLHELKATFAFVGAFTLTREERSRFEDHFIDVDYRGQNWLRQYRADSLRGDVEDWFCPEAFDMTREHGHEIASHGFCHVPFDDTTMPRAHLEREIASAVAVAKTKDVSLETFIYPRNLVAHQEILQDFGFKGYRTALGGSAWPFVRFLREFNLFEQAQDHAGEMDRMTCIPPGHFLNWRKGPRAGVPGAFTVARWKSVLRTAVEQHKVAHLWLHPHNLLSSPKTAETLEKVIGIAAKLRDDGQLNVQTQADYVRMVGSAEALRR